jgi:ketosteroid isomerase-like protein
MTTDVELVRHGWRAFAGGDLEAAAAVLDPHVSWYGAGEPDAAGSCDSREDAIAFMRQALADGVTADLVDVREVAERIVVTAQRHVPPGWGERPPPHGEVVTVRDGRITEIVVYASPDEAISAAQAMT